MSNIIPPLLSSTPPPIGNVDEEDDDFGDFTTADYSYGCDGFSIPNTPHESPKKAPAVISSVDINSNSSHLNRLTEKDHQDKRKDSNTNPPNLSKVPSDLNVTKDENVPSPTSKTDDFYREEPPEIVDDIEDDFGDFEYNPGLSIDQEDEETNMDIPEVVDFTCSEFIEDVKVMEINKINCEKSKNNETAIKIKTIVTESVDKIENSFKSKSDSIENSEESFNVINDDDDDFGDFEFQNATNYDEKVVTSKEPVVIDKKVELSNFEIHDDGVNFEVNNIDVVNQSKIEVNNIDVLNQSKIDVVNLSNVDTVNKSSFEVNNFDIVNKLNFEVDTSKDDFVNKSKIEVSTRNDCNHKSDSEGMCNGLDVDHKNGESKLSSRKSNCDFDEFKTADDSKFSLNSDEEAEHELGNFNSSRHIPKTFSENSNLEKTEIGHSCDNFDQIPKSRCSEITDDRNLENYDENCSKRDETSEDKNVNLDCSNIETTPKDTLDNSDFDDDFGDFADFRTLENKNSEPTSSDVKLKSANAESTLKKLEIPTKTTDDDFGDFASTNESPVFETNFPSFEDNEGNDDDFGEFDDYTSSAGAPVMLAIDSKNVGEKAKAIFEVMFPNGEQADCADFHAFDFIAVDGVFKEIKDVTDTNALRYQWGKSRAQKDLLKSLNIDTRNILYGPGINPMPKFAANLGMTPLEPMKSEILTPTPVSIPSTTSSQSNPPVASTDIPTAQFDWSESGLANPLDSVSKEEDTQNQENTTSNTTPITPRKSFDNESVNSLQFAEIPNDTDDQKPAEDDDFSDFTSFKTNSRNNMVPLRESYINNAEIKSNTSDEPGWLKPTILTPVLPRKYESEIEGEDEFTDFQMSLPPKTGLTVLPLQNEEVNRSQINSAEVNVSSLGNEIQNEDGMQMLQEKTNISKPSQNDPINILQPVQNHDININNHLNPVPIKKDEILQPVQKEEAKILQPVQVFKPAEEAVINWPDPGITEEELARFEMYSKASNVSEKKPSIERKMSGNTGLMLVEKSVVVPANKVVLPSKEVLLPPNDKVVISKDLVLPILDSSPRKYTPLKNQRESKDEEDDWTDFISIKPVLNLQNERTATPELPLSIPQLSHIQPPKLPIPVITPQGLMQTKIPSAPLAQTKNLQPVLHLNPPQDGYQPAIISHQYQMQMNQNVFSGVLQNASYQTTSIPANIRTTPTHQSQNKSVKSTNSSFDDSEEWTDFVSSRPTANGNHPPPQATKSNSPQHTKNYKMPQFNNWNSPLTPSNPYMTSNPYQNHNFQQFTAPRPNGLSVNTNKNNIPSISALPDLDFVTAKNRTFSKK